MERIINNEKVSGICKSKVEKSINRIHNIKRIKGKTQLNRGRKRIEKKKSQYPFILKTLNKLERKERFLNLIKGIYKRLTVGITFTGKRLNSFFFTLGIFTVLEALASEVRQKKKLNAYRLERKK